jgi:uncharacterized membrane protein YhaH (DUF805 family)
MKRVDALVLGMTNGLVSGYKHSFDWRGRADRSAYWWLLLWYVLVVYAPVLFMPALEKSGLADGATGTVLLVAWMILVFGTIPALISAAVRRLHDTGRSGWWWWLSLVLLIGVVLLILLAGPSQEETNEYGPPPHPGMSGA